MFRQKTAPAVSALPASLAVVFRGVIPSGHKWMTRSDYVPVKDPESRLSEYFCEDLGVLFTA